MTRLYTEEQVVIAVGHLSATRLRTWVQSGWVQPATQDGASAFTDLDVARIRLLCALNDDLAIDDDALPVILSLIDQIHGLRRQTAHAGRRRRGPARTGPAADRRGIPQAVRRLTRRRLTHIDPPTPQGHRR